MKLKRKNGIKIGVVGIVALLVIVSIYYIFINLPEETMKEEQEIIIDDQISPYTNQGLTVQILRMRHRGLLGKMNTGWISDRTWEDRPEFYYTTKVDEKPEVISKYIGIDGQSFKCWDTMGMECRDKFFIEEEQGTSDVTISIVEVINTGFLGRKSSDVVQETIQVTYDYRTGFWNGIEDSFLDSDGYGHYLGDTFEVWFNIYQTDYDGDSIPYWIEVNVLNTDPTVDDSKLDPDNDGIPTSWEWKWGYDPFIWNDHYNLDPDIDGIQNNEEYLIQKWWSNPYQPDVYLEVDFMEKKNKLDLDHILHEEPKQMVIERLAQHGIWLYVDDGWAEGPTNGGGEMLPFMEEVADETSGQCFRFYEHNFADERKEIFRYMFMANVGGFTTSFHDNKLDIINLGTGWPQTKSYCGLVWTQRARQHGIASVILHELGHTFGFMPCEWPGIDIDKPNRQLKRPDWDDETFNGYINEYHSIMNYDYIYKDKKLFDYSDGSNGPPYDRNDWEHVYIASFETNLPAYEESWQVIDNSFDDVEVVNDYPGVIVKGWEYNDELTIEHREELASLVKVKNIDSDIQVFVKNQTKDKYEWNLRVYAKPNVEPVYVEYVLVAEGMLDEEKNIKFYNINDIIDESHPLR